MTVQEQIDLFLELQKRGSIEAGFLAFLSLTAYGFSKRKPEKLFEARKVLKKLNLTGLDSMPLMGCLDLLLADIEQASARFLSSSDENLRDWLNSYSENKLEAICIFCKNWLENDVLVGYRDIDPKDVNLDSWFMIVMFKNFSKLEKKSNKPLLKSKLQGQQVTNKDPSKEFIEDSDEISDSFDEKGLPWPECKRKRKTKIQEIDSNEQILEINYSFYSYF